MNTSPPSRVLACLLCLAWPQDPAQRARPTQPPPAAPDRAQDKAAAQDKPTAQDKAAPQERSPTLQKELRGVWMTPRTPSGLWSRQEIEQAFEAAAKARFNTVFFNAWSRGWPLWRSSVFERTTGFATDPQAGKRDLLHEAVLAAHRAGIEVHAWMEYGFVGWWSGNDFEPAPKGPLFAKHPEWLAKDSQGSDAFRNDAGDAPFYWMVHHRPEVQGFLIDLHCELAREYDLDGIELDRIRYPGLDCGYDPYTVAEWRKQHGDVPPPRDPADAQWMRFRADELVSFHARLRAALRTENPHLHVSNAPSHYASDKSYPAYQKFLQDWRAWLRDGSVDALHLQMYVRGPELKKYIPSALEGVTREAQGKLFAGIAARPGQQEFSPDELVNLIETVREAGLAGHVLWFWNDVRDAKTLETLRTKAYPREAIAPYREPDWRPASITLDERKQKQPSGWREATFAAAHDGTFLAGAPGSAPLVYVADIKVAGTYDVYVHEPPGVSKASSSVAWRLFSAQNEPQQVTVDQRRVTDDGWRRLGTVTLEQRDGERVVALSNEDRDSDRYAVADAVMLVWNRLRTSSPGAKK